MATTSQGQNPDDVVPQVQDVRDVPSRPVAEAQLRHEEADRDTATAQEKKQAAVELASVSASRPDGSFAQLHETDPPQMQPSVAVADERTKEEGREAVDQAREDLKGSAPVGSEAARKAEQDAADARTETATRSDADAETRPAPGSSTPGAKPSNTKAGK